GRWSGDRRQHRRDGRRGRHRRRRRRGYHAEEAERVTAFLPTKWGGGPRSGGGASWGGRLIPAQRKQAAPPSAFGADPPPHGMGRRKKGVGREADALSFVRRRTRRLPDAGALLGGDIF